MNTIHSMSRSAQAYFSENFLHALTAQEKKVALVAVAIFAVAFLYCIVRFTRASSKPEIYLKTDLGDGRFKKVFKDGMVEIGQFKNEKLNGEGQRLFPDEDTDNLEGIEPYPKGHSDIKAQEGTFKDGVLSGQGKILFWNGKMHEGTFANGILVSEKKYSDSDKEAMMCDICFDDSSDEEKIVEEKSPETADKKVEEAKPVEDALSSSKIKVSIKFGADKYEIDIALTDTVLALKTKIYEKYGLEIGKQRLIYSGKILADDQTVESCNLTKDSVMVLALKPLALLSEASKIHIS